MEGGHWTSALVARRRLFDIQFAEAVTAHLTMMDELAYAEAVARRTEFEAIFYPLARDDQTLCEALVRCAIDPAALGGWDGPVLGGEKKGRRIREQ